MEQELHKAVRDAAERRDVANAVEAVYSTLADAIELRRPICKTSGRCCRFDEFGHRMYVTTLELAKFVGDLSATQASVLPVQAETHRRSLPLLTAQNPAPDGGCRYQINGLCSVHRLRPFGCRIFFCDATSTEWQHDLYAELHDRLRKLHETLNVPYFYVEWRYALKVCL